ncbi:phosphatidylserine decarboxylase [bacterium BMS3Bbin06]|nr:phosphatidylserine decarboxylase [bacterium BMS3Abin08]GBE34108.1 phosphatidylserine decarboxylase [bacterium BMS3Bbin06]HDO36135.1 phosphatidylserine decarboxylase family protein [Nitrospirota bacterium]HDY71099.1 phosphatidylserine decarboxylase family protein [Nitrospirota bacterium]
MLKIAPEGWPFIYVAAGLTLIVYGIARPWMAIVPFILLLFMVFFFRDPDRVIPAGQGIYVSPADGKVIAIKKEFEGEYLKRESIRISIFMSPLNVHVNRAPCDGTVELVKHKDGRFKAAFTDEASLVNENTAMVLKTGGNMILVKQIAGVLARRVVCRVKAGDTLKRGQRYGIVKFGSRVDIHLPADVSVIVKEGQKVRAGETVIARGGIS